MNQDETSAILLDHVNVKLGETQILTDVCAHIPRGSSTAIIGPNGAGKTSLALAILGQEPYSGTIAFPPHKNRKSVRFGFVPQKLQFDRDMPMTVMDYLLAGIQRMPLFFGSSRKQREKVEARLAEVECAALADRSFGALSGGEIQRILLAAALLQEPEILILDEPTAGVDFKGGKLCCGLLQKIREKRGFTQIMISHDLATVAAHADHVICIKGTVIAEGVPGKILTHDVLSRTFGLHLGVADPRMLAEDVQICDATCPHHKEHIELHPDQTDCQCHGHHHHHHCNDSDPEGGASC